MAVTLLAHEVSDICLGKPSLRSISVSSSINHALSVLKKLGHYYSISVWSCSCSTHHSSANCICVGKVSMIDVISFLCRDDNLSQPVVALQSPISVLIPDSPLLVKHLEPHASLVEAIDLLLEGVQNLVVPIQTRTSTKARKKVLQEVPSIDSPLHNNCEYCWLTQEDVIRYLLNSIGLFSPTSISPINSLNAINTTDIFVVHYDDPALSSLPLLSQAIIQQSSVAIVDSEGKLVGEISPVKLNSCDETLTAAIATLSAGQLMAYVGCGGDPPEDIVQLIKNRLEERNLGALLEWMEEESTFSSCSSLYTSSSDDDSGFSSVRIGKVLGSSARQVRNSEVTMCYPQSSLVAVMIQALAHRVPYMWVVEEDGSLVGIVTFKSMLKVFRERLKSMC